MHDVNHHQPEHVLISPATSKLPFNLLIFFCFAFQSAHLAMIDTLMMAYTVEIMSAEKVAACIRHYPSFNPEVETPYDTEDAVTTWINKVGGFISISAGSECSLVRFLF